ncbi:hypothetical protein [Bacillus sp. 166amftsu]|uniref:hypothetical protein n=1 Tax=Bacillus sp. 166amftsu TaxID=1761753 RepID=UPI001114E40D|nr:hypothetical protein [Bacillus sp. 166amftsu]
MSFPIQRSKPIMIFVSVMLILMVALPVGMLIVNKENCGSARIGMAFAFVDSSRHFSSCTFVLLPFSSNLKQRVGSREIISLFLIYRPSLAIYR